jgi:hypothetical protein
MTRTASLRAADLRPDPLSDEAPRGPSVDRGAMDDADLSDNGTLLG